MPDSTLPDLLIRRRNGGAPDRRVILAMAATGAGVDFGVETPGDYDLLLIGGSPVELRAFAIRRVR